MMFVAQLDRRGTLGKSKTSRGSPLNTKSKADADMQNKKVEERRHVHILSPTGLSNGEENL